MLLQQKALKLYDEFLAKACKIIAIIEKNLVGWDTQEMQLILKDMIHHHHNKAYPFIEMLSEQEWEEFCL